MSPGGSMPTTLNKETYERMIKENIEWLENNTKRTLERDHIIRVLQHSTTWYYKDDNVSGWHDIVKECEKLFGCEDSAESPLMSNLPNLIRDMLTKNNSKCVGFVGGGSTDIINSIARDIEKDSGQPIDWDYVAGRAVIKTTGDIEKVKLSFKKFEVKYLIY